MMRERKKRAIQAYHRTIGGVGAQSGDIHQTTKTELSTVRASEHYHLRNDLSSRFSGSGREHFERFPYYELCLYWIEI